MRKPYLTNEVCGAGMGKLYDDRPLGPDWQRVPGTQRVVSSRIPGPTDDEVPKWAGWRGIVGRDGVYDYETGRLLRREKPLKVSKPRATPPPADDPLEI